uniref:Cysteine protease n=1 Tax=Rhizochromulina marina TaxID=1034831 RepID=A0A7S2S9B6_9STRA
MSTPSFRLAFLPLPSFPCLPGPRRWRGGRSTARPTQAKGGTDKRGASRGWDISLRHPAMDYLEREYIAYEQRMQRHEEVEERQEQRRDQSRWTQRAGSLSSGPVSPPALVWLLGRRYHGLEDASWRGDFSSLIWCSYRRDFPRLAPYRYTTDAGWGCMIRAAQMIMVQGLKVHFLGRGWRVPHKLEDRRRCRAFVDLVSLFVDRPAMEHVYSLHNFTKVGHATVDKLPGEWYGPAAASAVLRDLAAVHRYRLASQLALVVAKNEVVYLDDIDRHCSVASPQDAGEEKDEAHDATVPSEATAEPLDPAAAAGGGEPESLFFDPLLHIPPEPTAPPPSEPVTNPTWDASLLLLIPLRLGLESVPPEHAARILAMLELPQSIGFIGGRPNHAIYFFGHHGNELHGLDPHTTQPTPEVEDEEFPSLEFLASLSCPRPQKLRVDRLDPSLALGAARIPHHRTEEPMN